MKPFSKNLKVVTATLLALAFVGTNPGVCAPACDPLLLSAMKNVTEDALAKGRAKIDKYDNVHIPRLEQEISKLRESVNSLKAKHDSLKQELNNLKSSAAAAIDAHTRAMIADRAKKVETELGRATHDYVETARFLQSKVDDLAYAKPHRDMLVAAYNKFREAIAREALNGENLGRDAAYQNLCKLNSQYDSLISGHTQDGRWEYFIGDMNRKLSEPLAEAPWWKRLQLNPNALLQTQKGLMEWEQGGRLKGKYGAVASTVCLTALNLAGIIGNFFSGSSAEACEPTKPNPFSPPATPTVSGDSEGAEEGDADEELPACPVCPASEPEPTPTARATPSPKATTTAAPNSR